MKFQGMLCLQALLLSTSYHVASLPNLPYTSASYQCSEVTDYGAQATCLPESGAIASLNDFQAKIRPSLDICPVSDFSIDIKSASFADDNSCSETKRRINHACCGRTGYCGYGPDYCGTTGKPPNDRCWSDCDAQAECGRYAETPGATCPLNVCCSEFGFCGVTQEFCGENCQSKCTQPLSGSSDGNVQSRVIGYYEAWAHSRKCSGMDFRDIPVGSLTHLYFAFGYISPESLDVVPMNDLSPEHFTTFTRLKEINTGIKLFISLGGWNFNDDTGTQHIFSNTVSSKASRAQFKSKLLSFLRNYGFDGVDFDWEYPGAPDRGGKAEDAKNYTQLLKELEAAIADGVTKYEVSFTAPTSYWYLRYFDLKGMAQHVDFVNVLSSDLHGAWDANSPTGGQVLAHTNLTEIKLALDLYWRNDVPPTKINLGLGFYGRSFQLAHPTCSQPGCLFKGGGAFGQCTENSGTLSYREIIQIIDQYSLSPYHDETNAVKYITWKNDQWVSYDDQENFLQKVKFANSLGLGGLLIWALGQDTADLQALQGVLHPNGIEFKHKQSRETKASYWEDATRGDCRTTNCGVTYCSPGEIRVTTQHCDKGDSAFCCPIASAPDPSKCTWRGTTPLCNGQCLAGEVALQSSRWGMSI
jgi:chitinase